MTRSRKCRPADFKPEFGGIFLTLELVLASQARVLKCLFLDNTVAIYSPSVELDRLCGSQLLRYCNGSTGPGLQTATGARPLFLMPPF